MFRGSGVENGTVEIFNNTFIILSILFHLEAFSKGFNEFWENMLGLSIGLSFIHGNQKMYFLNGV